MSTTQPKLNRLAEQRRKVDQLLLEFERCLNHFRQTAQFTGPMIYFHRKAIERRNQHSAISHLLEDDLFFDYLYATLTAWGMHRLGPSTTKLRDLDTIRDSIRAQASPLAELESVRIWELDAADAASIASMVWAVLSRLQVGISETKIVANSKALHHVLPTLVPPIDRQYTLRFLNRGLNRGDETAFLEIFPHFCEIGRTHIKGIMPYVEAGDLMNTSVTKVIDNAIVGYGLLYR